MSNVTVGEYLDLTKRYSSLEKKDRKPALKTVLKYLDNLNSDFSQIKVANLHDPAIAGDILANRKLYWPGCDNYFEYINDFENLDANFANAQSKFLFAFTVIASRWSNSSPDFRNEFYEKYSDFVDETLGGIAAMTIGRAYQNSLVRPDYRPYNHTSRFSSQFNDRLQRYDPEVHQRIITKAKERRFVLFKEGFNYEDADISDKLLDSI